jgi:hypothetical protein
MTEENKSIPVAPPVEFYEGATEDEPTQPSAPYDSAAIIPVLVMAILALVVLCAWWTPSPLLRAIHHGIDQALGLGN